MPPDEPEVYRATYQQVQKHQETLFEWLDKLIETDGLFPRDRRKEWYKLIGDSFIGVGVSIPAKITSADLSGLDGNEYARIENAEDLLRFLADVEIKPAEGVMRRLWKKARAGARRMIPFALGVAHARSPERFPYRREIHDPFGGERGG
ncbi:unnamed protein product [marine sediment metagenome]|uniref:Uncharacterized protein n=1 Tax=marine sediment metagenome TaxID=412755 RepID=X1NQ87_9ZZZZ